MEPETQAAILRAICKFTPTGIHKHFRILSIVRYVNGTMGTQLSASDIWTFLASLYDLNELEAFLDESTTAVNTIASGDAKSSQSLPVQQESQFHDFELPWNDFGDLIEEQCKAEDISMSSILQEDNVDGDHLSSNIISGSGGEAVSAQAAGTPRPAHVPGKRGRKSKATLAAEAKERLERELALKNSSQSVVASGALPSSELVATAPTSGVTLRGKGNNSGGTRAGQEKATKITPNDEGPAPEDETPTSNLNISTSKRRRTTRN